MGARLGGDNITTHLTPLSTGVNMVECCIHIALGETPDILPKLNRGSAIRYFKQHAGVINAIEGIKNAEMIKGIKQISVVHDVGEHVTDINNSASRMGFVIAQDKNVELAIKDCMLALERIKVIIN